MQDHDNAGDGVTVRDATADDIPALTGLLQELFTQEAEFTPSPERQAAGLTAMLAAPDRNVVLLAERGSTILGMVTLLIVTSTALGRPAAWLEDMVVAEGAQGLGIGRRLIDAALARCRRDGIARVTLLTDHDNHRAHEFYRDAGFERSTMVAFRRTIE